MAKATQAVDKRRAILDAAIRVFAREGYHATRVADIADEAGVAYGLVYHYFRSKEAVMTELFTERWSLLLAATDGLTRRSDHAREKLDGIAGFIIDSYRHDPELMKVIIVEVTRAANSFGRTHLPEIRRAYDGARIVARVRRGRVPRRDRPGFVGMWFYGAIEQLLSGWVFELIPASDEEFDRALDMVVEMLCCGLDDATERLSGSRDRLAARFNVQREWAGTPRWATTWSRDWSGRPARRAGALASIVAARVAAVVYRRIFDEDPPD